MRWLPRIRVNYKFTTLLSVFLLIIASFTAVIYYGLYKQQQALNTPFQCPADLPTSNARYNSLVDFNNRLDALNPNANLNDFIAARIDFYIGYGCISELEKYGYDGTSPIDATERAKLIQAMTDYLKSGNLPS